MVRLLEDWLDDLDDRLVGVRETVAAALDLLLLQAPALAAIIGVGYLLGILPAAR